MLYQIQSMCCWNPDNLEIINKGQKVFVLKKIRMKIYV